MTVLEQASADAARGIAQTEREVQKRKVDDDAALITSGLVAVALAVRELSAIVNYHAQKQGS